MHELPISRRALVAGSATLAAAGLIAAHGDRAAVAKTPMANTQVPAFYRYKVGTLEVTVVSDGAVGPLGAPADLFKGSSKEELEKILADNHLVQHLVDGKIALDLNALLVNSGDRLVLFDTGMGSAKVFGPNTGRLLATLKAANVDPKDIDAVVITHAHLDHCLGLMAEGGEPVFPNAQIHITQADFDFWTDEAKLSNEAIKGFVEGARKTLVPMRERLQFIKDGQEVVPGVQAMFTPGHTVGHVSFVITSEGQSLLVTGDVMHHHVISVEKPKLEFAFDTDPKQGVDTRLRLLDMLATDRLACLVYHFPWPGIGHVAKAGDGLRYLPMPLKMVL